jgi:hypothetical protein
VFIFNLEIEKNGKQKLMQRSSLAYPAAGFVPPPVVFRTGILDASYIIFVYVEDNSERVRLYYCCELLEKTDWAF